MTQDNFFASKRPWSKIKDAILDSYMSPYFAKLAHSTDKFLIIDAFAGPGKFEDGSSGSPLIICQAAERHAKDRYEAIFINLDEDHHQTLSAILQKSGYHNAKAIHGDSRDVLRDIHARLKEPLTIFLYLDPFGISPVSFDLIKPFLERDPRYSTEILINLQAPVLHRLAARNAFLENPNSEEVLTFHETLSNVLGGDYWRKTMLAEGLQAREREETVVKGYRSLLSHNKYLKFTGACPIQDSRLSRAKYYMIFASRHMDAMKLFNDQMLKAFEEHMNRQEVEKTLFADMTWKDWRTLDALKKIIVNHVEKHQGRTRVALWDLIVQQHFMRFSSSEYRKAMKELLQEKLIHSPTKRRSDSVLNDDCEIYVGSGS